MRKWSRISINNGKWFRRVMILCWLILNWLMTGKLNAPYFLARTYSAKQNPLCLNKTKIIICYTLPSNMFRLMLYSILPRTCVYVCSAHIHIFNVYNLWYAHRPSTFQLKMLFSYIMSTVSGVETILQNQIGSWAWHKQSIQTGQNKLCMIL